MAQGLTNSEFGAYPPGHFYSSIPSMEEVMRDEKRIWNTSNTVPGIDLNEDEQLRLVNDLIPLYKNIPFTAQRKQNLYYFFERGSYSYSDAIFLHLMLRHLAPSNVIEVGSGSSSCVMLDTNRHYLNNKMSLTFIDPFPNKMPSIPKDSHGHTCLIPHRVQDVETELFQTLGENDILFIDSTHVAKVGSDVNDIFFRILPSLRSGVHIHFHDIFFPFEYPKNWVMSQGRYWNEIYVLRSFLQYNYGFKIVLMNTFISKVHTNIIRDHLPLCLKNHGGSIWLRKL
jgi:hypothetical protein